ncbi:MAG: hypothetical protein H2045_11515 [Rhizobiales bacterium]|nr:hypothetical protein [Hyphomicrobiales bacterium]
MTETKPWYLSRAVWGALIAIAASIAATFGILLGEQDQASLTEAILQISGAIGALVALYGRLVASRRLK